jgi:diguanylate cyclase (GGDEF)-like protein
MFGIKEPSYIFPIKDKKDKYHGVCFIAFNYNNVKDMASYLEVMSKFEIPISMAALKQKHLFQLENKNKKLSEESIKDPLTGLFNRRHMQLFAEQEFQRALRFKHSLSLVMLDIDDFKKINDTFGHYAGDAILRNIAEIIKQSIRSIDTPIRYGGEEFLLILPNTNKENAYKTAERIRKAVENMNIDFEGNKIKCTISGGVSSISDKPKSINYMVCMSDDRLYKAKQAGKNQIVTS